MPVNKNALIRFRTIDKCLTNRQRRWTLQDLMDACSDALYDLEGIDKRVSKRTVQLDIQNMRSDKLGYNAPIVVVDKKYYTYEDPNFSIEKSGLSDSDLSKLSEVVGILNQFKGFSQFEELESMVKRLEDKIEVARQHRNPIIHLDRNEQLKGLNFLDDAYQAIQNQQVLTVTYHPFYKDIPSEITIHPYLLKSYNHRWYIVGFREHPFKIALLALDRIVRITPNRRTQFIPNTFFDPNNYFNEVIGVTVDLKSKVQEIVLYILPGQVPYTLTKPLHPSQEVIAEIGDAVLIKLKVRSNFELKKTLKSLGSNVVVITPARLRSQMENELNKALEQYKDKSMRSEIWKRLNALKKK